MDNEGRLTVLRLQTIWTLQHYDLAYSWPPGVSTAGLSITLNSKRRACPHQLWAESFTQAVNGDCGVRKLGHDSWCNFSLSLSGLETKAGSLDSEDVDETGNGTSRPETQRTGRALDHEDCVLPDSHRK